MEMIDVLSLASEATVTYAIVKHVAVAFAATTLSIIHFPQPPRGAS